ncbi:MAG: sensor histidine kinase, partial [Clostridia bacterium]|nr:sensor histidine kinase [Clostridia bacterium]
AARLPEPGCVEEADYQALARLLCGPQIALRTKADAELAAMMDYYTLWAHQIKTPIAAMRLRLQGEDSPLARSLLADLGRVERYVEMVLTYLRLEGSGTDYVIRPCELDGVIRPALKKFSGEFIGRGLKLSYTPTGVTVLTDEKWLSFVIEQALSNALKYTPEGTISVYLEPPRTLCVRDTGIGIAPEDLPRVFEQSFTGMTGRADKRASGIGLYLCRRVCDNLGHGIAIESEPGRGTVVRVDLSERPLSVE